MNGNDPLANLRDIHLPPPVDAWPPAWGWWLLAIILLLGLVALVIFIRHRRARNAWYRQALDILPSPAGVTTQDSAYYVELNQLMKRAARVRHPQVNTDRMSGEEWARFLSSQAPSLPADRLAALAQAPYHPVAGLTPEQAHALTRNWLGGQKC